MILLLFKVKAGTTFISGVLMSARNLEFSAEINTAYL